MASSCVFVPQNFDGAKLLYYDQQLIDSAHWFLDRLLTLSSTGIRTDEWGFTPLKVAYLRKVIPKRIEREIRVLLIDAGIIDQDQNFIRGQRSMGYRLTETYRQDVEAREILDPGTAARIRRYRDSQLWRLQPVHKYLASQFERLQFNIPLPMLCNANQGERDVWRIIRRLGIEEIANHSWTPIVCEYGRFHSPLTRISRDVRPHLQFDGNPLVEIDIANSQPFFLALLLRLSSESKLHRTLKDYLGEGWRGAYTMSRDFVDYQRLTSTGRFYEHLQEQLDLGRNEFKKAVFRDVFYGPNQIDSKLTRLFADRFPSVAALIQKIKNKDHRRLAWILQRAESFVVIDTICGRLMLEHPEIPVLTLHDSLLTTRKNVTTIEAICREEFSKLGCCPTFKVRELVAGGTK